MKRIFLLSMLLLNLSQVAFSQHQLSGKIVTANNTPLIGATVQLNNAATQSNEQGVYQINNIPTGTHTLTISYIGYKTLTQNVTISENKTLNHVLEENIFLASEVVISGIKAKPNSPIAYTNLSKEEILQNNYGQDLPYLLSQTPGMVVSSDAGTGIGYTGLRLRGTDISRINITVNGIPLNDAESQGVYWVNMPDFANSIEQIQIQRGVGTSTNGAASFGGSINMSTLSKPEEASVILDNSFGSYNTWRSSVSLNSGLLKNHFAFEARLSKIASDGYIDRATSDLKSYYLSGGYYDSTTTVKLVTFSGSEKTYQAWNGVPKVKLMNDVDGMNALISDEGWRTEEANNLFTSDAKTFNRYLYHNQTDNYKQDHYQLHLSHAVNNSLKITGALHYTHGEGYYESFEYDESFSKYGLPNDTLFANNDTITSTDLINQKWLDNDFYGATASATYSKNGLEIITGGAYNQYDGKHFGYIPWTATYINLPNNYQWYYNTGLKNDFNWYAKATVAIDKNLSIYGDLQYRYVFHELKGIHNDLSTIDRVAQYDFFNPKFGLNYQLDKQTRLYAAIAKTSKEPSRNDFRDADANKLPKHEELIDWEAGFEKNTRNYAVQINGFFMDYKDQLILTGEINDVGSAIMSNVSESYRAGIELMASVNITSKLNWKGNAVFSTNKIKNFSETVDNWYYWIDDTTPLQTTTYLGTTDIAFSPNITAGSTLTYNFLQKWQTSLLTRYVGKQFIDNSSNDSRRLNAYCINDLTLNYITNIKGICKINIGLQVNNILSDDYITNAWVYNYNNYDNQRTTLDGYFPQAPRNYMAKVVLTF